MWVGTDWTTAESGNHSVLQLWRSSSLTLARLLRFENVVYMDQWYSCKNSNWKKKVECEGSFLFEPMQNSKERNRDCSVSPRMHWDYFEDGGESIKKRMKERRNSLVYFWWYFWTGDLITVTIQRFCCHPIEKRRSMLQKMPITCFCRFPKTGMLFVPMGNCERCCHDAWPLIVW